MTRLIVVAMVLSITLLFAGRGEAGELLYRYPSYHYTDHLCALCDKRIQKVHQDRDFYIQDNMTFGGRPSATSHEVSVDTSVLLCKECYEKYRQGYTEVIEYAKGSWVKHMRTLNAERIEQHQKDNAIYKEKQDEIDRLRNQIQRLEMEKQYGDGFDGWKSGTSRAADRMWKWKEAK